MKLALKNAFTGQIRILRNLPEDLKLANKIERIE